MIIAKTMTVSSEHLAGLPLHRICNTNQLNTVLKYKISPENLLIKVLKSKHYYLTIVIITQHITISQM